jgi:hypothetical protein
VLANLRWEFYRCLTRQADAVFELTDAVLCADRHPGGWMSGGR